MNICYFFIKDQVAGKDIQIQYCPTEDMLADFLPSLLLVNHFISYAIS